jgi:hypothetical protein
LTVIARRVATSFLTAGGLVYFSPGGAEKVRERLCFLMKA